MSRLLIFFIVSILNLLKASTCNQGVDVFWVVDEGQKLLDSTNWLVQSTLVKQVSTMTTFPNRQAYLGFAGPIIRNGLPTPLIVRYSQINAAASTTPLSFSEYTSIQPVKGGSRDINNTLQWVVNNMFPLSNRKKVVILVAYGNPLTSRLIDADPTPAQNTVRSIVEKNSAYVLSVKFDATTPNALQGYANDALALNPSTTDLNWLTQYVLNTVPCLRTASPTSQPSLRPSSKPTGVPTRIPTTTPTKAPSTRTPTSTPTRAPSTRTPTKAPSTLSPTTKRPTNLPSKTPTKVVIGGGDQVPATSPPTKQPTTLAPSSPPTKQPTTLAPSSPPTKQPTTLAPSSPPTKQPTTLAPSSPPTKQPTTLAPSSPPTKQPTTIAPSAPPTKQPTTLAPSAPPTKQPTTLAPSAPPTKQPTTLAPSAPPTKQPTTLPPSAPPTKQPTTLTPSAPPTKQPTFAPTLPPSNPPTFAPSAPPTKQPTTLAPSAPPTKDPTVPPTSAPTTPPPTTAASGLNIDIIFTTTDLSDAHKNTITSAASRWTTVIKNDYPSRFLISAGMTVCGRYFPTSMVIENILILTGTQAIDGSGKVLARAGACAYDGAGFPRVGQIFFDSGDLDYVYTSGRMFSVSLHEMGHVLGLGTMWGARNLRAPGSVYPYEYTGVYGNIGNVEVGGTGNAAVEETGGTGTAYAHWKESVYVTELMTGWSQPAGQSMPLSRLTIRALQDLGFVVDLNAADPYTIPPPAGRRLRQPKKSDKDDVPIALEDDTITDPPIEVETQPKPGREKEFRDSVKRHRARKTRN